MYVCLFICSLILFHVEFVSIHVFIYSFVSSLSFLGLGVQPPLADWGSMVRENLGALQYGESVIPILAPAIAIASLTVAINLIVDDVSAHAGGKLSGRL